MLAGVSSSVKLKFVGEEGSTKWITVSENGFEPGNVSTIEVKTSIVGGLQEMLVKVDKPTDSWICSKVKVSLQ